jgi:hydrogenase maturation protease
MKANHVKVLVIGYGNPGRLDDGLGPAAVARLERDATPGVTLDADYQLTVEHAAQIADHDVVVFVDADTSGPEPFGFRRIAPAPAASFSTHSVQPEAALGLAHQLFNARTSGYVLGIRGYTFNGFGEALSDDAAANLDLAVRFLENLLQTRNFAEAETEPRFPSVVVPAPCPGDEKCKTQTL